MADQRPNLDQIFSQAAQSNVNPNAAGRPSLQTIFNTGLAPTPQKSWFQTAADASKTFLDAGVQAEVGALKYGSNLIRGASSLGQRMLDLPLQGANWVSNKLGGVNLFATNDQQGGVTAAEQLIPEQKAENAMQTVGMIGGAIGTAMAGGALISGTAASGAAATALEGSNLAPWLLTWLPRAAQIGTEAALMGTQTALEQGKVNKEVAKTAGLTAGIGVAGFIASDITKAVGNFIFRSTVPTTVSQSGKDMVMGRDIGQAVADQGISVSKKSLVNKLTAAGDDMGNTIDDIIHEAGAGKAYTLDDVLVDVKDSVMQSRNLKAMGATPIDYEKVGQTVDDVVDQYKQLYSGELTADTLQALKKDLGIGLKKTFDKALGASVNTKIATELEIRSSLQKTLEALDPRIAPLNKEFGDILTATGRLQAKGNYSGYLTDVIVGAISAGDIKTLISNPKEYVKNFLLGVVFKRILFSTASKTTAGTMLNSLSDILSKPAFAEALVNILKGLDKNSPSVQQTPETPKAGKTTRPPLEQIFQNQTKGMQPIQRSVPTPTQIEPTAPIQAPVQTPLSPSRKIKAQPMDANTALLS